MFTFLPRSTPNFRQPKAVFSVSSGKYSHSSNSKTGPEKNYYIKGILISSSFKQPTNDRMSFSYSIFAAAKFVFEDVAIFFADPLQGYSKLRSDGFKRFFFEFPVEFVDVLLLIGVYAHMIRTDWEGRKAKTRQREIAATR